VRQPRYSATFIARRHRCANPTPCSGCGSSRCSSNAASCTRGDFWHRRVLLPLRVTILVSLAFLLFLFDAVRGLFSTGDDGAPWCGAGTLRHACCVAAFPRCASLLFARRVSDPDTMPCGARHPKSLVSTSMLAGCSRSPRVTMETKLHLCIRHAVSFLRYTATECLTQYPRSLRSRSSAPASALYARTSRFGAKVSQESTHPFPVAHVGA